jgi:hypothetical protein
MKVRQIRQRAKTHYISEEGFKFLRGCFGKRCRTYTAGCALCDEWRFRDEHGRFVYNFAELRDFMRTTEGEVR